MTKVPTLLSGRLILRAHRPDDLNACAQMWSDPDVVRHITKTPSTRTQTWGRMLNYAGLWSVLGYGYWAIEESATHAFVGDVGLADFHRIMEPSIEGTPEAGWVLSKKYWGKGYATEAASACLEMAKEKSWFEHVVINMSHDNIASRRVAEHLGAKLETTFVNMKNRDILTNLFAVNI